MASCCCRFCRPTDKNHFRAHAHGDTEEFVSVLLYLLCIMVWALFCFGLVTWFMAKTAFRLNDIGLPGWALAVACYVCSVLNNYSPGPVARWLPLFSGRHDLRPAVAAGRAAPQAGRQR